MHPGGPVRLRSCNTDYRWMVMVVLLKNWETHQVQMSSFRKIRCLLKAKQIPKGAEKAAGNASNARSDQGRSY